MREIKFRAKAATTNRWVYGHYAFTQDYHVIYEDGVPFVIALNTLGQYTGLKDRKGVEIYEGDIVKRTYLFNGGYGETHTGEVVYDKEYARYVISRSKKHIEPKTEDLRNTLSNISTYEVIGNIYENPELLEREAE